MDRKLTKKKKKMQQWMTFISCALYQNEVIYISFAASERVLSLFLLLALIGTS